MTTPADPTPEPPQGATPDQIEADIAATRERLADTVDALGERLDVKEQAKRRVSEVKHQAQDTFGQTKDKATRAAQRSGPALPVGAAVAVVLIGALVLWRKRR
ncbi:DUF3618 domain-containing protein [Aeromicrobium camelliae]|uniref:DUF3618 domain-containing protein n=1 Tax=Aeromicrobium camelliae TaxID=1538144 RepID=A0A3N6WKJ1_9ACTN|nr:DUF3618 domain-containing protein [Aeromicrobium camelliae]RQN07830.1 DUF3618 domain-containing protein [Aeromicrobium camelliae]